MPLVDTRYPSRTMVIKGPAFEVRQKWLCKYGVWFSMDTPRELWPFTHRDAATEPEMDRICRVNGFTWRWLEPIATSRPEAPPGVL